MKQILSKTLTTALVILSTLSQANDDLAVITGTILEQVAGQSQPLPFANVSLIKQRVNNSSPMGTTTNFDGKFTLSAQPGEYLLIVSFIGYQNDTISIQIGDVPPAPINITLKQNSQAFDQFVIEAKRTRNSEQVLLMERRESTGIEQNVGSKQLASSGASNVATGLKSVAGLSVRGSKHLFVRGLGDRYNSAYLNGLPVASLDPDKKVIPLDLFPSSIVSSLNVRKAFGSNLYGDFSGGAIDIRTKEYEESPTLNVSVGSSLNMNATFNEFSSYDGGKYDTYGFEDGSRSQPVGGANSANSGDEAKLPFSINQNPNNSTAPTNQSFQLSGGNYYKLNDKISFGVLAQLAHRNSNTREVGSIRNINLQDDVKLDYDFTKYTYSTSTSGLLNFYVKLYTNHEINFNSIGLNQSSDQLIETHGTHFDYAKSIFTRRMTYKQNSLLVNQVSGRHEFINNRLRLNWAASTNTAIGIEPDRKQLVWLEENGEYQFNSIDRLENHRFFSELEESLAASTIDATWAIIQAKDSLDEVKNVWTFTVGQQTLDKAREFDYAQYVFDLGNLSDTYETVNPASPDQYLNDEHLQTGQFSVSEVLNPASKYNASLQVVSYFANSRFTLNKWQVSTGVRVEDGTQSIRYRDQQQPVFVRKQRLSETEILPAISAVFTFNPKSNIRFSASKTMSRPGFKEVAPFEYTEVFAGVKSTGNPNLKNGENYNADIRYEIYPGGTDLIGITGFGKILNNPIERTMLSTASGQLQSFQNAESAHLAGIELEYIKALSGWFKDTKLVRDLSFGSNVSLMHSNVTIANETQGISSIQTNNSRALQGASPYIVNTRLQYKKNISDKVELSTTLTYNIYAERIAATGVYGMGDIYEMPVNSLNLITNVQIKGRWSITLSLKNLIDQNITTVQQTQKSLQVLNEFSRGRQMGISIRYKFYN